MALAARRSATVRHCGDAGIIGARCSFGDALITPAISVPLREGLKVVRPDLTLHCAVRLRSCDAVPVQWRGTARVASLFGPIMVVWFAAIALPGAYWMVTHPGIILHLIRLMEFHSWSDMA